ncbi:MAG TPA: hypothetical protein VGF55_26870 [Gemmataceae bacterium]|jgi:hypothetical protein
MLLPRRPLFGVTVGLCLVLVPAARADVQVRTQNFVVRAPDQQTAQQFGQMAEQYRRQKALDWLGYEMPPWPRPCPLTVKPTMGGAGGATRFNYDFRGNYEVLSMDIEGEYTKMLHSVLPHEVTHTVFAHYFRYPVPRWADEGGSVLSENDAERQHHDRMIRNYLNGRQGVQLRRLFNLKEYSEISDVMVLYAEGFSVSNYLVGLGGRQAFLGFVALGLRGEWDKGVQTYYHMNSVEQLEQAWLKHLADTKGGGAAMFAQQTKPQGRTEVASADAAGRLVVRQTAPPAQPQLDPAGPVARGQSDDDARVAGTLTSRPAYLPDSPSPAAPVAPLRVPAPPMPPAPVLPPVRLGVPEFGPVSTPH